MVKKFRFLIGCGVILSVCVLLAVAAEVNEPTTEGTEIDAEAVDQAEVEATDPNSAETPLGKAWADADRALDSESKQWLNLEMDKRTEFARASQKTTEAQLELLKIIAVSESATQTIAAIDKILEARSAKVDEVLDEAREARRQERIQELEERRKAREELRQSRRERTTQQQ